MSVKNPDGDSPHDALILRRGGLGRPFSLVVGVCLGAGIILGLAQLSPSRVVEF